MTGHRLRDVQEKRITTRTIRQEAGGRLGAGSRRQEADQDNTRTTRIGQRMKQSRAHGSTPPSSSSTPAHKQRSKDQALTVCGYVTVLS